MSQSTPPPQPPQSGPSVGNPYAQQAPAPAPGAPYPPQQGAFAAPAAPAGPVRNNLVLGLVAALAAAVVVGSLYGVIIGATKHEIGWAAVGVGFVVGLAAGKAGGRNPALPVVGAVLALGSVYLGQLVGEAMLIADHFHVGFNEVFFEHLDSVQKIWKEDADPLTFVFFGIAAFAAFSGAKKAAA
ncbi:hypothetical protein JK359_05540 [Streptomyces actinomycinicus]|uniref:Uncharacterized protein n=1 Tax=Streptomyces actinomycinicus TaxID=1695166 RepID=A0A937JKK5_9ACTN|nr:hypothetical protein [Streptomyces actinomycinicus]MBL1081445.1 hypothetical protein [Streptomyces actinomycinicus]